MGDAFLTSFLTVTLFSLVIWILKFWIAERIKADMKLENDAEIEHIKAELAKANSKMSSIVAAGGNAYSQAQAAMLPKKIEAIEAIWSSVLSWNKMSTASMFISVLPLDWVKKYGSDPKTKENFEMMLDAPSHLEFMKERNNVEAMRPFVSARGWALYSAFNTFYLSRISKAAMFLFPSFDHAEFFERLDERELVAKSAPQDILEKYDANVYLGTTDYLNYLRDEMINEFRFELSGERDSDRAAGNATEILKAVEGLMEKTEKPPVPPGDKPLS